jgi:hypothetical protein
MDGITIPSFLVQGGATAVLVVVILLILAGRLVPRRVVSDIRSDRDDRIAEMREEVLTWRTAYETSEKAREVIQNQFGELLELARTTDQFIRAISVHPSPERRTP